MGLFGKKKNLDTTVSDVNSVADMPVTEAKAEGKKKAKKQKTIMRGLDFEESVMEMIYEKMDSESGAIRKVDGGYLAVVLNDSVLQNLGAKNEAVGSFAKAVKDRAISVCVLPKEIEQGHLIILPDSESFDRLEEFTFIRNGEFNWCFIPEGLDEDGTVKVLDQKISFSALKDIAESPDKVEIVYDGENVVVGMGGAGNIEDMYLDDIDAISETGVADAIKEESVSSSLESFDEMLTEQEEDISVNETMDNITEGGINDIDVVGNSGDTFEYAEEEPEFEDIDDFDDELDIDFDEFDDESYEEAPEAEPVTETDFRNMMAREFFSEDLDIVITDDLFNAHFAGRPAPQFAFKSDVGEDVPELIKHIRQMASTANTYIEELHSQHEKALRDDYYQALSAEAVDIMDYFDITNPETLSGQKKSELESMRASWADKKDSIIANQAKKLRDQYDAEKRAYVAKATDGASRMFDVENQANLNKKIDALSGKYDAEADSTYDKAFSDFLDTRKRAARLVYDKATTRILQNLSDEFRMYQEDELKYYEKTKQEMDDYLKAHYSDDILRAKALREELARHNEVDDIRKKYEELQIANEEEIKRIRKEGENSLVSLRNKHDEAVKVLADGYEEKLKEKDGIISEKDEKLRAAQDEYKELQSDYIHADERKQKEFEHRLAQSRDEADAKNKQIEALHEEMNRQDKRRTGLTICIGIMCLLFGLVVGFLAPTLFGGDMVMFNPDTIMTQIGQSVADVSSNISENVSLPEIVENVILFH